jgi:hypothetical protein
MNSFLAAVPPSTNTSRVPFAAPLRAFVPYWTSEVVVLSIVTQVTTIFVGASETKGGDTGE